MAERKPFRAYAGDRPFVFVSYSHRDSAAVYPVIDRLFQQGWNIWYDQGLQNNVVLDMEIASMIRRCEAFIVFLSPNAANSEYVCQKELPLAVRRGKKLYFVRLDENDRGDYSGLTGGRATIAPAAITAHLPAECRECEHRDPQPIEVDVSVGLELIADPLTGFEYAVTERGLIITAFLGSDEDDEESERHFGRDIVIPARHNGLPVIGIAIGAFDDITVAAGEHDGYIKSITLPDIITELEEDAFKDSSIQRIELPAFLTDIGMDCFSGCSDLEHIELPHGLLGIDSCAFWECVSLDIDLVIPETVRYIGAQAFGGCSLSEIIIPSEVTGLQEDVFSGLFDEYDPDEDDEWDGCRIVCVEGSEAHRRAMDEVVPVRLISRAEMEEYTRPLREKSREARLRVQNEDSEYARVAAERSAEHGAYACVLYAASDEARVRALTDGLAMQGYRFRHGNGASGCVTMLLCLSRASVGDRELINSALACGKPVFPLMLESTPLPEAFAGRFVMHAGDMEREDLLNSLREHLNTHGCKGTPHSADDIREQFGASGFGFRLFGVGSGKSYAVITGYTGKGGEVVMPGTMLDAPVTRIWNRVFAERADIHSVVLPDSVNELDSEVFADCRSLERVRLPGGELHLGNALFTGCGALREIIIPAAAVTSAMNPFEGCPTSAVVRTKRGSQTWELAERLGLTVLPAE